MKTTNRAMEAIEQLSDHDKHTIIKEYENFERTGILDVSLLRNLTDELLQRQFPIAVHPGGIFHMGALCIAMECYRYFAHRHPRLVQEGS